MLTLKGPRRLAFAFAASLVATSCSSGDSSAAPSASSTFRASTTPAASPSASAPPLVQEGGAPLGPGTYTTVFQPKITFTTDTAWVSYADTPDFVSFERPARPGMGGNGGIAFKRIDKVLDPTGAPRLMPVPKDYLGWIVSLPGVKVLAGPKAVTVDGFAATLIDVTATTDAPTVYCKDPCVALWPLGRHADFQGEVAALNPDFVSRIVVIRLHGETVELSACCAAGDNFEALAKDFDTMLRSVRFG